MASLVEHHLPGEGNNSEWFESLNDFERQETRRQVAFKRAQWPALPDGPHAKFPSRSYPHILPAGSLDRVFYAPIVQAVIAYCRDNDIAIHSESLNLRSSQVCCFNVLFPLRQDLSLATIALAPVLPSLRSVSCIEFEFTGPPEATQWLGEPSSGKRGQNRTSIDAAIWWEDQQNRRMLTLAEWKYTERSYGTCGGYTSKGNTNKTHCCNTGYPGCSKGCYLTEGRNHRHYWEHLAEAGIDDAHLRKVQGCPFRGPFYQLWRQFLLSGFLQTVERVDEINVVSLGFSGNGSLETNTPELAGLGDTVVVAWNSILKDAPPFRHVAVESIVQQMRRVGAGDAAWLDYLAKRYGL